MLVTFLGRCCRFLIEEINHFGEELIRRFCNECLAEYARSMMKDQVFKVWLLIFGSTYMFVFLVFLLILTFAVCPQNVFLIVLAREN